MSTETPPLLTEIVNNTGVLTLNRPKEMNAVNDSIVTTFVRTLQQWEGKVQCVVLRGAGGKAFCVGGDLKVSTPPNKKNSNQDSDFIKNLQMPYTLIYEIARYGVPFVALLDGVTFGLGVGISVHCRYRIVTERTMLALPETSIGLFPDSSASYFLSRLPQKLGMYLGFTGHKLKGKDIVKVGLGTHFVKSENIPKLFDAILNRKNGDVGSVVERFSEDISSHKFSLDPHLDIVNYAFSAPTVEEILQRLQSEGSEFSLSTIKILRRMSPISLKVTKRALESGARMSLQECLQLEFRLDDAIFKAVSSQDFYEGVRAILIDKDRKPKWNPATVEDVTDDMVDRIFKKGQAEKNFYCKL